MPALSSLTSPHSHSNTPPRYSIYEPRSQLQIARFTPVASGKGAAIAHSANAALWGPLQAPPTSLVPAGANPPEGESSAARSVSTPPSNRTALGYNNPRAAHDTPHLAPCALDLLAAANADTPAHSLVVAHVRQWNGSRGAIGLLDGTPAHSVLDPSAPRIPPNVLQFRAHAVSAVPQCRPLPALESAPRHAPDIRVARVEAAHKLPVRRADSAQRAIPSLPRAFHPHSRAPSAILAPLPAAPTGGGVSKSRRLGAVPASRRLARASEFAHAGYPPVPAPSFFPRRAPSAVCSHGEPGCSHGELGCWHAAVAASLRDRSRPPGRQAAPPQRCFAAPQLGGRAREFCGRRPGPAREAYPRMRRRAGLTSPAKTPARPRPRRGAVLPLRALSVSVPGPHLCTAPQVPHEPFSPVRLSISPTRHLASRQLDSRTMRTESTSRDYILNLDGVEAMIASLKTFSAQLNQAVFKSYTVDGLLAGQFKTVGTFSYIRIYGAGHEVPAYKNGTLAVGQAAF
ncbi:hypothetical protein B0H17DRAFT_1339143 [Mycena rosella]|uniref:Carboxypeptidase n=1 Tax=Mycena rosella TaxID=1033263 RepID=A0AAD7C9R8_MYCRO|nr:hypothetical protein B0H17DRAFT_1339143 [Mycena rosella]